MNKRNYSRIILAIGPQQTLFRNVVNYQRCLVLLKDNTLIFDTLDEKFTFHLEDIKGVRFIKINGTLVSYIDTKDGMFIGSQTYREYKEEDSKNIFNWLKPTFLNGKLYEKLIKSKSGLSFRMFTKQ